jgi:basic membrane protein A and related proteins
MDKQFSFSSVRTKYCRMFNPLVAICTALLIISAQSVSLYTISARDASTKVGMIILGSFNDRGFNWLSYQGLLRAESDLSVTGTVYQTANQGDLELLTTQCATDGNDLCIGVGFMTMDAITHTAGTYTQTYFAIVDAAFDTYLPNLRSLLFASEEAGYLAGTLAAQMSQSGIIGDLGGMEIPPVVAFTEGYRNGAMCANPDITTIISYTNNFGNPDDGADFSQGMIGRGADVIFAAAGPTGDGAVLTATQSGVWAIGVDTDQYYTLFDNGTVEGANYLLSSAMKRVDNAVYMTISDVVAGNFTSGPVTYDLETDGVGLAPFHETDAAVPLETKTWLNWISQAIIADRIAPLDPGSPCLVMHHLYLSLTSKN